MMKSSYSRKEVVLIFLTAVLFYMIGKTSWLLYEIVMSCVIIVWLSASLLERLDLHEMSMIEALVWVVFGTASSCYLVFWRGFTPLPSALLSYITRDFPK